MLRLLLRLVRSRAAGLLATIPALALGVALVTATGLVLAATLDTPAREPQRYAAAPVVVVPHDELRVTTPHGERVATLTDPPGLGTGLRDLLAEVGAVVEDRTFDVGDGVVGHPWSAAAFTPYRLTAGNAPRTDSDVVVTQGIAELGGTLRVGAAEYTVTGVVPARSFERAAFFTDAEARRLSPRLDALVVHADPTVVTREVGDAATVVAGPERRSLDPDVDRDAEALISANALVGTASGIAVFVAAFLVASSFAYTVSQRRREFALLRVAGATPRQVRTVVLAEALVVGCLGSVLGCLAGRAVSPALTSWLVDRGLAPHWFQLGGSGLADWPLVLAGGTGLVMAQLGAWAASRRAASVHPAEALRESATERRAMPLSRWLLGAGLLATGVAMGVAPLVSDPGSALKSKHYVPMVMVLLMAVAVLAPALVSPLARLLVAPLSRSRGAVGLVAGASAAGFARRTATTATPVLLTVGLAAGLLGSATSVEHARADEVRDRLGADYVVTSDGGRDVPDGALQRLRDTASVEVAAMADTTLYDVEDGTALLKRTATAVDPSALRQGLLHLPVEEGSLADLTDDTVVVDTEWRRAVGDEVDVWRADGTSARLRVVAVISTGAGGNGAFVTRAHVRGGEAHRLLVRTERTRDDLTGVLSGLGVSVSPVAEWSASSAEGGSDVRELGMWAVLGLALVYTGLSVSSTLISSTRLRGEEFRTLRLSGATNGQLLRVVATDALSVVALGTGLAAVTTATVLTGLGAALTRLGAPVAVSLPWPVLAAVTGACGLVAVLSAVVPAAAMLRKPSRASKQHDYLQ
ncbi:FtsX-like permease family protein [Saccharomonospora cyanea]|uniref:ABC-type transport system, involved in lipoprotein release, permease component n=1 Tax=Saccharomonospora cyanea NA-134 TaxID=882082 RepID=H5XCZ0_9PSEU|nr:ABC transporter permease [Saccharomonospora cyanea]EHR62387.1 ABC-type transport system, involved in lipoprotein release, permease component [Saccharomonospora cyanea NA-134]